MEVQSATFSVKAYGKTFRVNFLCGKVRVYSCSQTSIEYDNPKAEWKPCATHAKQLVQMAFGVKPSSRQAQRRAKDTRPSLRVFQ